MSGSWIHWVIIIGPLLGIGLAAYFLSVVFDRRRTEAFTLAAQQLGFKYQHDGVPFPGGQAPVMGLFDKGHSRRFSNLLNGWTAGLESAIFDYRYTVGRGKSAHTAKQTVAAYRWPSAIDFQLAPPTWGDKVGAFFGKRSIQFEDAPEFTKRWHVQGADPTAVQRFFTPAIRTYVQTNLAMLVGDSWHIEANEGWVLIYRGEHRVKGPEVPDFVRTTSNVIVGFLELAGQHQTVRQEK